MSQINEQSTHTDRGSVNEQSHAFHPPKIWDIGDPFEFAPPKPDGDPWSLLLDPLLKADKERCDAWRDEVQNLLIFVSIYGTSALSVIEVFQAGLFSAVVTAFVVESYKNLQPDRNDAVISLLSGIATRLDSTPGSDVVSYPQASQQFSPETSAIRINTVWFISLVLSLTTVLIGTISLQWLREHQSFAELSPREKYAVYHMRYQSLIVWHVDKIFATLPLLLQCSLVLFLIGIIDFLHSITAGNWTVTIPVTIVVGFTFLFLIATAMLPSLQALSLYFDFSTGHRRPGRGQVIPPSPCPYKSPQSRAVRSLSRPLMNLLDDHLDSMRRFFHRIKHLLRHPLSRLPDAPLTPHRFTQYLYYAALDTQWMDYDISWLAIRDGFMRRAFGKSHWRDVVGLREDEVLPLYDIVHGLDTQSYQKQSAAAAYHCFSEISEMTLQPLRKIANAYGSFEDQCRESGYLHNILEPTSGSAFLPDRFPFVQYLGSNKITRKSLCDILHQDNMYLFLHTHSFGDLPLLSTHRKELSLRLSAYFYRANYAMQLSDLNVAFPECLTFTPFEVLLDPDLNRDQFNGATYFDKLIAALF
ncbi:hypothetical protein JR316_0012412 [Psilocybe cubensis]|uniref:Uncharacterized protein n=1 Tax=Psilocybe cubensis TaxID=181762 RepID=A0ACB8GJA7_PSICU|nr:hypothetical protein JR316_0012412 [Psilocybe cubensis]KAH9475301.1 hypothetical protein JR316_0012412 [Psilocybe cubensis]